MSHVMCDVTRNIYRFVSVALADARPSRARTASLKIRDVSESLCSRDRSRIDGYVVVFCAVLVFLSDHLCIDTLFVADDLLAVLTGPFDMSTCTLLSVPCRL